MTNGAGWLGWARRRLILIFSKDRIFARAWRAFNLVLAECSAREEEGRGEEREEKEEMKGRGTEVRSLLSTSIDRGIEIDRIDVEKYYSRKEAKSTPRRRKILRAPKIAMRRFPYANV